MASLTELRASRYEDVSGDRAGTEQRAARESSGGRTTIPAESQAHYREDYGVTLTDKQYESANTDQAKFKDSVAAARGALTDKKIEVDNLYSKQITEWEGLKGSPMKSYDEYVKEASDKLLENRTPVNSRFKALTEEEKKRREEILLKKNERFLKIHGSAINHTASKAFLADVKKDEKYMDFYNNWYPENTVKVSVKDPEGHPFYKEYYVTPDTAKAVLQIDFQGEGKAVKDNNGGVFVISEDYAWNVAVELDKYEAQLHSSLRSAYYTGIDKSIVTGRENLDREMSLATEGIDSQNRIITAKEAENTNTLNTIRTMYSNKLKDMSDTIGSMQYA